MSSAQRVVWGETMVELVADDDRVLVLDADLATSTRADLVAEAHPDRFVQIGIAEQNMVGVAFGLTTMGYRPWLSSFSVFLTHRALDQVRMLVAQTKAPVRLASSYSGLLNGSSGKTHEDLQDFAIMRAMPGMTVIAPADAQEAREVTRWAAEHDGPVYVRYARDPEADVFAPGHVFVPGRAETVREGSDVVLVSTGVQTARTLAAAELLAADGVQARVVHLATLKPVDGPALLQALGDAPLVVTSEDHSVIGGLGSLVAELLAESGDGRRLVRVGLADGWAESAPNDFLLDKYGLSPRRVAERVRAALDGG